MASLDKMVLGFVVSAWLLTVTWTEGVNHGKKQARTSCPESPVIVIIDGQQKICKYTHDQYYGTVTKGVPAKTDQHTNTKPTR